MKISVIIPNYNGQKLLAKNLPKVIEACPGCEIIIVDDASTDESVIFLQRKFPKIKIIQNKTNQRFGKSCNIGAKKAQGDLLFFLNSDAYPQKDFLKPLLKYFDKNQNKEADQIFSVACREINNKKEISGRTEGQIQKGLLIHYKPKDQESKNTLWGFGGSILVDKNKFLELGGFDPIYHPAYWEDIDLCWQAKKKGWQVLFEKDSIIYHNHETTNKSVFGNKKIQKISLRNQIIFSLKNFPIKFYFWLPYHLIFTTIKTKGLFLTSFLNAIKRYYFKK